MFCTRSTDYPMRTSDKQPLCPLSPSRLMVLCVWLCVCVWSWSLVNSVHRQLTNQLTINASSLRWGGLEEGLVGKGAYWERRQTLEAAISCQLVAAAAATSFAAKVKSCKLDHTRILKQRHTHTYTHAMSHTKQANKLTRYKQQAGGENAGSTTSKTGKVAWESRIETRDCTHTHTLAHTDASAYTYFA